MNPKTHLVRTAQMNIIHKKLRSLAFPVVVGKRVETNLCFKN
jgi:hypothetical protein